VTFDIDANGIVHVSAKDKGTGKEQKITITSSSTLNDDEIKRMVNEGEAHEAEDKKARELAEARNQADALIYQTEKTLKEHGSKLSDDDRAKLESALTDAKSALDTKDLEKIKEASEKLQTASHKLAEAIYSAASQTGAAGPEGAPSGEPSQGSSSKEDVVDAEFEDADKGKK